MSLLVIKLPACALPVTLACPACSVDTTATLPKEILVPESNVTLPCSATLRPKLTVLPITSTNAFGILKCMLLCASYVLTCMSVLGVAEIMFVFNCNSPNVPMLAYKLLVVNVSVAGL